MKTPRYSVVKYNSDDVDVEFTATDNAREANELARQLEEIAHYRSQPITCYVYDNVLARYGTSD